MNIGGQEWLLVLLVILLIFGARKLPELARSLGSSAKEFRKGIEEGKEEDDAATASSVENTAETSSESPPSSPPDAKDS